MILSEQTLAGITSATVAVPDASLLSLPEKVLQFGTGVLLRGLPDYFIDKANRQKIFNGRIVVVKSTAQGDATAFAQQDGLYTLCVRGIENGSAVNENIINASISRVLHAASAWNEILACAQNPQLQIVVSNTTEIGLQLVAEDIFQHPPASFPAKLLRFLWERFQAFGGSPESGMVIIPTELLPQNGTLLKNIVLQLARFNNLSAAFIVWLQTHHHFCNSLVDRIVPGRPDDQQKAALEAAWGYSDDLSVVAEVYRLWAIEGSDEIKKILLFAQADEGVVIVPDINLYRELKLRLLNGTHTLSCAVALLCGCRTVKQAMDHSDVAVFMSRLLHDELAPAIPYEVDRRMAHDFGHKVLERFRNPFIEHQWLSISMQYSSKLAIRVAPVLLQHYKENASPPLLMALSFAAYFHFMKPVQQKGNAYFGLYNGDAYPIKDDKAGVFFERWKDASAEAVIATTLQDKSFWSEDLSGLPHFSEAVISAYQDIEKWGMRTTLERIIQKR